MPKVGMKGYAEQHVGQKGSDGVKIGQKHVKKSGSKPVVLEPEFMESLKKLKL